MKKQTPDFQISNDDYELTVYIPFYNHIKFLSRAIESALKQVTNFNYKILLYDDCSTDGSEQVAIKYAQKHENIIHERTASNVGNANRISQSQKYLDTKYIAFLDVDDYWIDNTKLQKQYDILESHLDVVVTACSFLGYDANNLDEIRKYELLTRNNVLPVFMQSSTMMYRNIIDFSKFPSIMQEDGTIHYLFILYGNIFTSSSLDSYYTYNDSAIYSTLSQTDKNRLNIMARSILFGFFLKNKNYVNTFLLTDEKAVKWIIDGFKKYINTFQENEKNIGLTITKEDMEYINLVKSYDLTQLPMNCTEMIKCCLAENVHSDN